jgi:mono/diheme cytochrome c family protein
MPPDYRSLAIPEARLTSPEARRRGRILFLERCSICHGERADGQALRGNLSVQPADFTDPAWRRRFTPRRAFYVIREGKRGPPMPAWKSLSENETWDLVAYILSLAEPGSKSQAR